MTTNKQDPLVERLEPCPFCGGNAELREDLDYHTGKPTGKWWATCPPCDLIRDQGFCVSRDEAITAWNTRTPDPRIEVLERLSVSEQEALEGALPTIDGHWFARRRHGHRTIRDLHARGLCNEDGYLTDAGIAARAALTSKGGDNG